MKQLTMFFTPRRWKATSFLSIAALALVMGCQDFRETFTLKPLNGIVPRVSAKIGNTSVNGSIVDAKTGEALPDLRVLVKISGADAGRVVDANATEVTGAFYTKGAINLFLKGDAATLSNPAKLIVSVSDTSGKFLSTTQNIQVTDSIVTFKLKLVNKKNPPSDIKIKADDFDLTADGKLASQKSISSGGLTLNIPSNVQFLVNGSPAKGKLTALVSAGGGPAGSTIALQEGNSVVDAAFTSYGFVNMEFSVNGEPATFTNGMYFTVPASGIPGDAKRFTENGGIYEQSDLGANIGGTYYMSFPGGVTTFGIGKAETSLCTFDIPVAVKDLDGNVLPFAYKITPEGGETIEGSGTSKITFTKASSKRATLSLFDDEGKQIGTSELIASCSVSEIARTVNKKTVKVTVNAVVTCADARKTPTIQVYPEGVIVEYGIDKGNATTYDFSAIIRNNTGVISGLKQNTKYLARISFQGTYTGSFTTGTDNTTETISVPIKSGTEICR